MLKYALSYLLTFITFLAIDLIWLGWLAKDLYRKHLSSFLSDSVNWPAAIVFYLIFIAGIFVFVVLPSVERNSLVRAAIMGAFFGLVTYATYDLTNLATMKYWPIKIVIIDLLWGATLTALVSMAGFWYVQKLVK